MLVTGWVQAYEPVHPCGSLLHQVASLTNTTGDWKTVGDAHLSTKSFPTSISMRVGPRFVYTVGGTESVSIRYLMMSGIMHTTTKNTINIVPITQR